MRGLSPFPAALAALLMIPSTAAPAEVHFYRYDLSTASCVPDQFRGELPSALVKGRSYRVETDAQGRLAAFDALHNGKAGSGYRVRYRGSTRDFAGWYSHANGKPVGGVRCIYNLKGELVRTEAFSAAGTVTEYTLVQQHPSAASEKEIWSSYTLGGRRKLDRIDEFSPEGVLIRFRTHRTGSPIATETAIDPETGLRRERQVFDAATHRLMRGERYSYNANGERVRTDHYDGAGQLTGSALTSGAHH
jgi:hypothetical protein